MPDQFHAAVKLENAFKLEVRQNLRQKAKVRKRLIKKVPVQALTQEAFMFVFVEFLDVFRRDDTDSDGHKTSQQNQNDPERQAFHPLSVRPVSAGFR
mgnify:FL=1|jgi:hypothetical protein